MTIHSLKPLRGESHVLVAHNDLEDSVYVQLTADGVPCDLSEFSELYAKYGSACATEDRGILGLSYGGLEPKGYHEVVYGEYGSGEKVCFGRVMVVVEDTSSDGLVDGYHYGTAEPGSGGYFFDPNDEEGYPAGRSGTDHVSDSGYMFEPDEGEPEAGKRLEYDFSSDG